MCVCVYIYMYIYVYMCMCNDLLQMGESAKSCAGSGSDTNAKYGNGRKYVQSYGHAGLFYFFIFWLRHGKYAHRCQLYFRLSPHLSPPALLPSSQLRLFLFLTPSLSVPLHCLLPPLPPPPCLSLLPLFVPLTPRRPCVCVCMSTHTNTHTLDTLTNPHWTHTLGAMMQQMLEQQKQQQNLLKKILINKKNIRWQ